MADKNLQSITFPGITNKYKVPQVAPAYSASSTYVVGDYVNNAGTIYRCTTAITTAEAWTAGHWTAAMISSDFRDEVADLKSALSTITEIKDASNFSWSIGKSINASGTMANTPGFAITSTIPVVGTTVVYNATSDKGYNNKSTTFWVHEFDENGDWLRREQILAKQAYFVKEDCTSMRIAYGYPQNQSVTMTDELLNEYFSAIITEEKELKKNVGYRKILTIEDDVNQLENGFYRVSASAYPHNLPTETTGIIGQFGPPNGVVIFQIFASLSGVVWYRTKNSSGNWSPWKSVQRSISTDEMIFDYKERIDTQVLSNGELYEIPIRGETPFTQFKDVDGTITPQDIDATGTDYIKAPPFLIFTFDPNDENAQIIIYFFDSVNGEYIPRWDILDFTSSSNIKNVIGLVNGRNRVIEIPDGVYMRIRVATEGNIHLYGWSGNHFGVDFAGYTLCPYDSAYESTSVKPEHNYVLRSAIDVGYTGLMVPGSARFLCGKDVLFREVWGVKNGIPEIIVNDVNVQSVLLPSNFDYFTARLITNVSIPYNKATVSSENVVIQGNLNDSVSCLCSYTRSDLYGRAKNIIKRTDKLLNLKWKSLTTTLNASGSDIAFKYNVTMSGVPYCSRWTRPNFIGWHISAHTFVNAANDVRSTFYKAKDRHGGPPYGLVCSSFATLVSGWPYPLTNNNYPLDPKCHEIIVNKPIHGEIMTLNREHCVISEGGGYGSGFELYSLVEQASPLLRRNVLYDFITSDSNESRNYDYMNDYKFSVSHEDAVDGFNDIYDLDDVEIINGSARPYRGDRCVFTSESEIKINIKNTSANICYYQKCSYDPETRSFTLTGTRMSTAILTDDGYYSVIDKETLEDSCFYAVWTNVDDTKEYFEYHYIPYMSYSVTNNNFIFNIPGNEFWYALWWQDDVPSGITEIVPYLDDGDYSAYRKVYDPNGADGYVYFKGILGAYTGTLSFV